MNSLLHQQRCIFLNNILNALDESNELEESDEQIELNKNFIRQFRS